MPADAETLLHANLHEVFGERDPDARRAALERTFAPDAVFADENGEVAGHDAIDAKAGEILGRAPVEFVFAEDGPAYVGGATAALAWRFGPPGGEPVVRGLDVLTFGDGLITHLRTLLALASDG
jgi:hypothetical protein